MSKRKTETHCEVCGGKKKRKKIAYGEKRVRFWCSSCDRNHVGAVNKSGERFKARREMQKQIEDEEE